MNKQELIRKIEIHIETTEESIENFNLPQYVIDLLDKDNALLKQATDLLRELEADCKEEYRVQSIASYFSKKTPYPTAWSNDILDYILNRSKDLPQPPKTEK